MTKLDMCAHCGHTKRQHSIDQDGNPYPISDNLTHGPDYYCDARHQPDTSQSPWSSCGCPGWMQCPTCYNEWDFDTEAQADATIDEWDRRAPRRRDPVTLEQAASQLGMSPAALRVQVNRGVLKARKLGPLWIVDQEEVERYAREHRRAKA